jgi:hypothetical protein
LVTSAALTAVGIAAGLKKMDPERVPLVGAEILLVAHLPVMFIETVVAAFCLGFLKKVNQRSCGQLMRVDNRGG